MATKRSKPVVASTEIHALTEEKPHETKTKILDGVIEMRHGVSPRKSPLKVVSTLKGHLGSFGRRFSMSTWFFTLLLLYSKCFGTGEGGTFAGLQHSPAVLLNRVGGRKHDGKCPGGELRLRAGLCSSLWC